MTACRTCGTECRRWARHCDACADWEYAQSYHWATTGGKNKGSSAVAGAVRVGRLAKLDGSVPCVDCGKPAEHYDHRDYNKPLDVQPVCRGCNYRRGRAIPLVSFRPLQRTGKPTPATKDVVAMLEWFAVQLNPWHDLYWAARWPLLEIERGAERVGAVRAKRTEYQSRGLIRAEWLRPDIYEAAA